MVIVKLQGGLGNQMFQYATAKRIACNGSVYFDMEFLNTQTKTTAEFTSRQLELSIFKNIAIKTPNQLILHALKGNSLIGRLIKSLFSNNMAIIHQSEKNESINLSDQASSITYLDGYFQNENYFSAIKQQLFEDFEFPLLSEEGKAFQKMIATENNAVSIHIRRGDYLKPEINRYHGVLPLSYYQTAQKSIATRLTSPHYYIFSDDPEWCRENIELFGNNATIVSKTTKNTWEDMHLMSLCKHHIIANSSYSWWGAWLNKNPDKVVIAPISWFASTTTNIVPENWIKI